MKSVAICGKRLIEAGRCDSVAKVELHGIPITFGCLKIPTPTFDPQAHENRLAALIEIRAFSCNYRDKGLMLNFNQRCRDDACFCVGSEFVGEVLAVGPEVATLHRSDRVIGNNAWPHADAKGVAAGVPTNHASQRYRVIHVAQLMKIPPEMPDSVAAAFGLGAQTSYGMIRRMGLAAGMNILVTAAKSNTSMFVISALKKYGVNVYATTTSLRFESELREMGVKELFQIDAALERFGDHEGIRRLVAETGGFDCVIDPFYDLHMGKLIGSMTFGGRYITCGLYDQHSNLTGDTLQYRGAQLVELMNYATSKNIQFIGHCLGSTEDLRDALEDYRLGRLNMRVDAVFRGDQVGAFFDRTYNAGDRFGKVVYQYS
jgi:NADPH:quinone reductase-like Zn-dependent oxidoreductase